MLGKKLKEGNPESKQEGTLRDFGCRERARLKAKDGRSPGWVGGETSHLASSPPPELRTLQPSPKGKVGPGRLIFLLYLRPSPLCRLHQHSYDP